jgi:hypothetical protein
MVIASISETDRAALVLHIGRRHAGHGVAAWTLHPQAGCERLKALTPQKFAFTVFVESCPIAISC